MTSPWSSRTWSPERSVEATLSDGPRTGSHGTLRSADAAALVAAAAPGRLILVAPAATGTWTVVVAA